MLRTLLRHLIDTVKRDLPEPSTALDEARDAFRTGDLAAASGALERPLHADPVDPNAHVLRAEIAARSDRWADAEADYRQALLLRPDSSAIRLELAAVLHRLGRFDESLLFIDDVLAIEPTSVLANMNRGLLLKELGEFGRAEEALLAAINVNPGNTTVATYLASVLSDLGSIGEARMILSKVLGYDQSSIEARWVLATTELGVGEFASAWEHYEFRLQRKDVHVRPRDLPWWQPGSECSGGLLVLAEQGLGDEIIFASCFPDLLEVVESCLIECDPRLGPLFSRSFPRARILPIRNPHARKVPMIEGAGAQIAAGSLPRYFRSDEREFPRHTGYLRASSERLAYWHERLNALGAGLKIGLAWTGGVVHTRRALRSVNLRDLEPLLRVAGVDFVSLQYVPCEEEIGAFERETSIRVHHWPEAIADYDETASLVSALDLVIAVTTAVVDLCGALGRPVWVMVPVSPDWRYMRSGTTTPWYPSARLFRQTVSKEWAPVIEEVRDELVALVTQRHRPVGDEASAVR